MPVDLLEGRAPTVEPDEERVRREALLAHQNAPDWLDTGAAAVYSTYPNQFFRFLNTDGWGHFGQRSKADPSYMLESENWDELTQGIPRDYWSRFGSAGSHQHALDIRQSLLDLIDSKSVLSRAGWSGRAASITASLTDPAVLAVGALTGGTGLAGSAGTTVAGMARAGFVMGAPFAALEYGRSLEDPTVRNTDIALAGASGFLGGAGSARTALMPRTARFLAAGAGQAAPYAAVGAVQPSGERAEYFINAGMQFALGGAFNAIHATEPNLRVNVKLSEAGVHMANDGYVEAARAAGVKLTPEGEAKFSESINTQVRDNTIFESQGRPAMDEAGMSLSIVDELARQYPASAFGPGAAAQAEIGAGAMPEIPDVTRKVGDIDLLWLATDPGRAPKSAFVKTWEFQVGGKQQRVGVGRASMASFVGQSDVPMILDVGFAVMPDPVPRQGEVTQYSLHDWAMRRREAYAARFNGELDIDFAEHRKTSLAANVDPMSRDEFKAEVSKAVRRQVASYSGDPIVNRVADRVRERFAELHDLAKRQGAYGWDRFDSRDTYLTRLHQRHLLDAGVLRFGEKEMVRLWAESIQSHSPNVDPKVAVAMARAVIRNGGKRGAQTFDTLMFSDPGVLAERLKPLVESGEITPEAAAAAVAAITAPAQEAGVHPRAKTRINTDETYRTRLTDQSTGEAVDTGIEDFLDNDIEHIFEVYSRSVIGVSAIGELTRSLKARTGVEVRGIEGIKRLLAAEAEKAGVRADSDIAKIEAVLKMTAGYPLYENTMGRQIARGVRNFQRFRLMSSAMTGVRNSLELTDAVAELGMGAFMRQMPAIGDAAQASFLGGKVNSQLVRELGIIAAYGEGSNAFRLNGRVDPETHALLSRPEQYVAFAGRLSGYLSLQTQTQNFLERTVGAVVQQKILDIALGRGTISAERARLMGWTPEDAEAIARFMKKYALRESAGAYGERLVSANEENWSGKGAVEAATKYRQGVELLTSRLVQQSNPAQSALWMTTEIGKIITQFKQFAIQSWENKALTELSVRDVRAFYKVMLGMGVAGAGYIATTVAESAGRPDADEYLAKRLTPEEVAKAAFARASFTALMPSAIDTTMNFAGRDPLFANTRTTGLQQDLILGNPTVDWMLAAKQVPNATSHAFGQLWDDRSFTRDDLSTIQKGLGIPNVFGVKQLFEIAGQDLPRHRQQGEGAP